MVELYSRIVIDYNLRQLAHLIIYVGNFLWVILRVWYERDNDWEKVSVLWRQSILKYSEYFYVWFHGISEFKRLTGHEYVELSKLDRKIVIIL